MCALVPVLHTCALPTYPAFGNIADPPQTRVAIAYHLGDPPDRAIAIAVAAIGAGGDVLLLNRIREATLVHLIHLIEAARSEEHTSELQSLMRSSYYVFFLINSIARRIPPVRLRRPDARLWLAGAPHCAARTHH